MQGSWKNSVLQRSTNIFSIVPRLVSRGTRDAENCVMKFGRNVTDRWRIAFLLQFVGKPLDYFLTKKKNIKKKFKLNDFT